MHITTFLNSTQTHTKGCGSPNHSAMSLGDDPVRCISPHSWTPPKPIKRGVANLATQQCHWVVILSDAYHHISELRLNLFSSDIMLLINQQSGKILSCIQDLDHDPNKTQVGLCVEKKSLIRSEHTANISHQPFEIKLHYCCTTVPVTRCLISHVLSVVQFPWCYCPCDELFDQQCLVSCPISMTLLSL